MYRKLLGYNGGNRKSPIFEPMAGALVTRAFIHCCECREPICSTMGPRQNAYCIPCTEKKEAGDAVDAKAEQLEKEKEDRLARAEALLKAKAEEDAKYDADNTNW